MKNDYIQWNVANDSDTISEGTYYVVGAGINGVETRKYSLDTAEWNKKSDNEEIIAWGELTSPTYRMVHMGIEQGLRKLTPDEKKKAYLEDVREIINMFGERKADSIDQKIVQAVIKNDLSVTYVWMNLDDIRDECVLYYFNKMTDYVDKYLHNITKEPAPAKETPTEDIEY